MNRKLQLRFGEQFENDVEACRRFFSPVPPASEVIRDAVAFYRRHLDGVAARRKKRRKEPA